MRIDPRDLRQHYQSLSDEELLAIEPADLTAIAKKIYDEEVARRNLTLEPEQEDLDEPAELEEVEDELDIDAGPPPDWLEEAACACSFAARSKTTDVPEAAKARSALRTAGIPCHIVLTEEEGSQPLLNLMVPGPLNLHAISILDRDIFNPEYETHWQTHVEALSDQELLVLSPEIFCAGLLDRVARVKRVYESEMTRRGLLPRR